MAWQHSFITFSSGVAAVVLNALWQDALLVLCVWLMLRAWPKVNAATRYVVWCATLVAAFAVPIATTLAFFTQVRVVSPAASRTWGGAESVRRATAAHAPSYVPAPAARTFNAAARELPQRLSVTLSAPLGIGIFALWLALAAYGVLRLTIGLLRLEQLKRDAMPLPVEYRDSMPLWPRANKGARDVRLCVSEETDVPIAVGLFDAMILVPRSLLQRLSEPEVDQICLHELGHLRRADDWTNALQRLVTALLGWNPAVQFVGQQLDLEREVACDDWVLSYVQKVRPYALCLTKMAESAAWPRRPIPAPGVFDTRRHISLRIERLLGVGRNIATNMAPAPAAAAIALVTAIAIVIGLVSPSVAAAPIVEAASPQVPARVAIPVERHTRLATTATAAPAKVTVPATHVAVPAAHVAVPATHVEVPATHVEVPATHVEVPPMHVDVPATKVEVPRVTVEFPSPNAAGFDAKQLTAKITNTIASSLMQGLKGTSVAQGNACVGCNYSGVNWPGKDLRGVNYKGVDLSKANLAGADLSGSTIYGVDFTGANLGGASFRNAHVTGCDFTGANLTGADFTGAWISGCQFTRARLGSSQLRDVLNGCKGCDFSKAELAGLDLRGVRTNGDDFSGADLRNANFAGAQLVGTDFSDAKLDGANFTGATLDHCDLTGVNLTRVDLSKAKLIGTELDR